MSAREVAAALTDLFIRNGNFDEMKGVEHGPQTAAFSHEAVSLPGPQSFAGLSVRAVGFAEAHRARLRTAGGGAGEVVRQARCYVYVTRSSKKLETQVEREIDGVEVVIRKVGRVYIKPELASSSTNAGNVYRVGGRIACGSSLAVGGDFGSGTLGAFVKNAVGTYYALSNNHVIGGCNHVPPGQAVMSPSTNDVRPNSHRILQFARLTRLVELRSGDTSYVPAQEIDAAIAEVEDRNTITSMQGDSFYDTPAIAEDPVPDLLVKKVGRTTGLTHGTVESLVATLMPIPYKASRFQSVVYLTNVWMVRSNDAQPFALPGDSGSLVVREDNQKAVGLLFAASPDGRYGCITGLPSVLTALGSLSLVSGV